MLVLRNLVHLTIPHTVHCIDAIMLIRSTDPEVATTLELLGRHLCVRVRCVTKIQGSTSMKFLEYSGIRGILIGKEEAKLHLFVCR